MTTGWQEQLRPGVALREIVQEATTALIAMDAERLEELARCCADLNRDLRETGEIAEAADDLRESSEDIKLLGSILFETRANLTVLSRLHAIRLAESVLTSTVAEDGPTRAWTIAPWKRPKAGGGYGDN